MYENRPYPSSMSEFGKLRFRKKSDLLTCAKPASTEQPNPPPFYDCKIFDGAAVVHALPSKTVSTFDSFAEKLFIPIKDTTREKRGNGQRRKVTGETKIPPNWNNTNKK